jgi:hypothetical protein
MAYSSQPSNMRGSCRKRRHVQLAFSFCTSARNEYGVDNEVVAGRDNHIESDEQSVHLEASFNMDKTERLGTEPHPATGDCLIDSDSDGDNKPILHVHQQEKRRDRFQET